MLRRRLVYQLLSSRKSTRLKVPTRNLATSRLLERAGQGKTSLYRGMPKRNLSAAKLRGLQSKAKTCDGWREQPVAGVRHRAGKHQVAVNAGPCHQLLKQGLMPLRRQQLHRAL